MKVWANAPGENWIIDQLVREFKDGNPDIWVDDPSQADLIWLLSDFSWRQVPTRLFSNRMVVASVHHIVPEKWDNATARDFVDRDAFVTVYHVPNEHTAREVRKHTYRQIVVIPYWANADIWKKSSHTQAELRVKYNLPINAFIAGSFQRDTEGAGIPQGIFLPKKEKGPDLLAVSLERYRDAWREEGELFVLLAGWRRQYIIQELVKLGIPYKYFEMPSQEMLCELYQCLDLYPVTARYEGGPQSLVECGLLNVPVVSRNVGIASQVLHYSAIKHHVCDAEPAVPNVEHMKLPLGFEPYRKLFKDLYDLSHPQS